MITNWKLYVHRTQLYIYTYIFYYKLHLIYAILEHWQLKAENPLFDRLKFGKVQRDKAVLGEDIFLYGAITPPAVIASWHWYSSFNSSSLDWYYLAPCWLPLSYRFYWCHWWILRLYYVSHNVTYITTNLFDTNYQP